MHLFLYTYLLYPSFIHYPSVCSSSTLSPFICLSIRLAIHPSWALLCYMHLYIYIYFHTSVLRLERCSGAPAASLPMNNWSSTYTESICTTQTHKVLRQQKAGASWMCDVLHMRDIFSFHSWQQEHKNQPSVPQEAPHLPECSASPTTCPRSPNEHSPALTYKRLCLRNWSCT